MSKVVLDLCGGTGSWSKPYKDAGYAVVVITLPEYNVGDWWITDEVIRFRKQVWKKDGGEYLDIPLSDIYGVLAAPPCTMFSVARTVAKIPRDYVGGLATVNNCIKIIQSIQKHGGSLSFWALENPRGHLRKFLGKPPYEFKHWHFEQTDREKPTDIWGNFNLPKPVNKTKPTTTSVERAKSWGNPGANKPIGYEHITERAALRAITPQGFANAFYKANK
jgi:hypothetical protein